LPCVLLVEAFPDGRELFKGEVKIRKDRSAQDSRKREKVEGRIMKEEGRGRQAENYGRRMN